MGYSRDSFYRFKEHYEKGGNWRYRRCAGASRLLKNRVAPEVEEAGVAMGIEQPAWGQLRVSNELQKQGLSVSPAGVRGIWQRHALENLKKRLKALAAKVAQEGRVLTKAQLVALEKAQLEKEAQGEFESKCPKVLGWPGHFLGGDDERRRTHLPADVYRSLRKRRVCQAG